MCITQLSFFRWDTYAFCTIVSQKADAPHTSDPNEAWRRLLEGNKRFARGDYGGYLLSLSEGISSERREHLTGGQAPFAIVVSCSDSRSPPEIIFNQGLGHIFVIRFVLTLLTFYCYIYICILCIVRPYSLTCQSPITALQVMWWTLMRWEASSLQWISSNRVFS